MNNFTYDKNALATYYNNDYYTTLLKVQLALSEQHADAFSEQFFKSSTEEKKQKARGYVEQYVRDKNLMLPNIPNRDILVDLLHKDMTGFSVLEDLVADVNNENEEINVNRWNDIEVRHRDGSIEKWAHFCNPEHATNIIKRMCGGHLDDVHPMSEETLGNNTRIVAIQSPIVDKDAAISASIRLVKPTSFHRSTFIKNETVSDPEMSFVEMALQRGVSVLFVGGTGTGKTTLMNYVLSTIRSTDRIYTIEQNARELDLVKRDEHGVVLNNVVHTLTNPNANIDQEALLNEALRFDPYLIAIGEMRGIEAAAAVEAALTGHVITSSLHASGIAETYMRIATTSIKKYPMDIHVALLQAAMAFPMIVYLGQLDDHSRHVMEITECYLDDDFKSHYNKLYGFDVTTNERDRDGNLTIQGQHHVFNKPTNSLVKIMRNHGATETDLREIHAV